MLKAATRLLQDIPALYQDVTDEIRGLINDAIYSKLWLDEDDVVDADLRPPFDEIAEAADPSATTNGARSSRESSTTPNAVLRLPDVLLREPSKRSGRSSRTRMAEGVGFEPTMTLPPYRFSRPAH